ncbi:MAG TPA: hypothetical protein VFJ16_28120 [Longimicrobium sp.]|nr:hypothetical protein [Longimicrobium sp.]
MLGRSFPLFLVPRSVEVLDRLEGDYEVQIHWDERSWYLSVYGDRMFSFDLPPRLFARYARSGLLPRDRALELKRNYFGDLHAVVTDERGVRVIRFHIDQDWIGQLMEQAERRRPGVVNDDFDDVP